MQNEHLMDSDDILWYIHVYLACSSFIECAIMEPNTNLTLLSLFLNKTTVV